MNQTYDLPQNLGDLMGAYDEAHWQTAVLEIKAGIGVLKRGTILASGTGADIGKLVLLSATTEAQAYGVLLDPSIDTAAPFSDGSVTGSIAKAGSFKGSALIVPAGVDAGLIAVALRGRGIFVEGPITVPAAAAMQSEEPAQA
jgi:Bacteriophage lambda head decoration protein D